jgi:glycosyltransferase involved in cell wall biosynthesis
MRPVNLRRTLIAIPAFNEEKTIGDVVQRVCELMPHCDLVVIDDGSEDATGEELLRANVRTIQLACNLGYGRAIQTAIKYALAGGYEALVTLDADGQHRPEDLEAIERAFWTEDWDYPIGSRYVRTHEYGDAPIGRRLGMRLFSTITGLVTGRRVYDTTSGLKVIRRNAFAVLTKWHFVDFHAEAIVYLTRLGYRVGEYPITVEERHFGTSMYSFISHLVYPLQTLLMVVLGAVEASLTRARSR